MGLAHVTVTTRVWGTLVRRQRVLLTGDGPFWALSDYFADNGVLSLGWQTEVAMAVGLLIDFAHVVGERYLGPERADRLLPDFHLAIRNGTVRDGEDPTGLYWTGSSKARADLMLAYVCNFSDHIVRKSGAGGLEARRPTTPSEQIAYWRRWNTGRASDIQRHQAPNAKARSGALTISRVRRAKRTPEREGAPTRRFPDSRIMDLLFTGFAQDSPGQRGLLARYNLRDILITILMHGGGLRISEAFHIFINDVVEDPITPGVALVRVYHPEDGMIRWRDPLSGRETNTDRTQFLKDVYGREPRTKMAGGQHAGWKNPALTEAKEAKYIQVHWFPQVWGEMFWTLYKAYVTGVYPAGNLDHPYLFVSLDPKHYGQPYTMAAFAKNHANAIRRIGMQPGKHLGTTPHAHRHAMGSRMDRNGVSGKVQTSALHHASALSRLIYNEWSSSEINTELALLSRNTPEAADMARFTAERLESDIDDAMTARDRAHKLTIRRR